ncbi:Gfo/Idh/MocA family oxidoreductase [Microbacterium sp. 5K110]|uniref:Gfo/Idh/MocA family protein n=1 Tax=unclassified Microbacterium TaxID=2609290 RepID=UPI00207BB455|nr:Gfo/Idh/MocA family oxidoreductase [Microbacterium sp. 5K110]
MAEDRAVRVGIIGGGFMAAVHSRAARAAGADLVAVASSSPERGRAAATALGARRPVDDADALIADPEIEVVHICTPNDSHERLALRALDAGKHVVCEKPLALSRPAAAGLAARAASAGRVATVPFVYRFHPMVREARALTASGSIGRVLHVDGRYLQDWLLGADDVDWRVDAGAGGRSRAFADIGSHVVDLLEFVTGDRIVALTAITSVAHAARGGRPVATEDMVHVLVRLASGCHGSLTVSQVAAGRKNALRLELYGSDASIGFDQEHPDRLLLGRRAHTAVVSRDPAALSADAARLSIVPAGHPMGYQDAFTAFVRDTYDGVITGSLRPEVPTFADGARAALLTDLVLDSAVAGEWVDVPSAVPA